MWRLLRTNRDVRCLFISQVVSYIGDWFAYVAFVGVVQDLSDRSILVTLVLVAQALPAFLVTPIAGPTADRFNRQVVIGSVSLVQAVAALVLLMVNSVGTLWMGYLCLCVISALSAFVAPAAQAALPNLTAGPDELAKANVLFGSLWGAMLAVGAAAGGLVAGVFGRDVAFLANAASFVVAAGAVAMIRRPMQAARDDRATRTAMRPIADMREAFGYARRDSVLLAMLASKATFAVASGIVGLLAVFVTAHIGGGAQWTLSTYGLQVRAPDHVRGRILAGDFGMVTLIITLSNLSAGLLADTVGPRPTTAVFALLCIAAAAGYLVVTRPVRLRLEREANQVDVEVADG